MDVLKRAVAGVLNINFIWAALILLALGLCAWQHYMPTETVIPRERLEPGVNTLTLTVAPIDDNAFETPLARYVVEVTNDADVAAEDLVNVTPVWPEPDAGDGAEPVPLTVAHASVSAEAITLVWDIPEGGRYILAQDQYIVSRGQLVTLGTFNDSVLSYAETGFSLALNLVATMVLFLGLMKVGEKAGVVQLVARGIYPLIRFLFPDVPKNHPANGAILMNWTTTLLGLANAATPFGLKAMKELQELNPHKHIASNSQIMLLGYNTAGLALLPTTLIALRKSAGVPDPLAIIGPCMFAGLVSTIVAIIAVKAIGALPVFSMSAALSEDNETDTPSADNEKGD